MNKIAAIAAVIISTGLVTPATAQSAQYCAGIAGGSIGQQNMNPDPALEKRFADCMNGKRPAAPAADKSARQGKKVQ